MVKAICPICGKETIEPDGSDTLPFCSKRCRQIDLGRWLSESYRIASHLPGDAGSLMEPLDPAPDEPREAVRLK